MKLIAIQNMQVLNANAIAGQTYGCISPISILGFMHALERKLKNNQAYNNISMLGCVPIIHTQNLHVYQKDKIELKFLQTKNPPPSNSIKSPVIEEGRMNCTLSIILRYDGLIDDSHQFLKTLEQMCYLQRIAGGSILNIQNIKLYTIENDDKQNNLKKLIYSVMPGFIIHERSDLLKKHICQSKNIDTLDGLMDFCMLKSKARPVFKLIQKELELEKNYHLQLDWQMHLSAPYQPESIPESIINYFNELSKDKHNKALLEEWNNYKTPSLKTDAIWQNVPKPEKEGFFVPLMCGYKAISEVFHNQDVENIRDKEHDVCFVEAVHTLAEWKSVHHIKKHSN